MLIQLLQGLKHINVRIELKLAELETEGANYSGIKAYQCSYRTETLNTHLCYRVRRRIKAYQCSYRTETSRDSCGKNGDYGLKHINVRIELKPRMNDGLAPATIGLKHINVRIELKLLLSNLQAFA